MDEANSAPAGPESPAAASPPLAALAAALVESDEVILKATTEAEVYAGLCRVIVRHLALPLAWVGLTEPGTHGLRVQASAGAEVRYLEEAGFDTGGVTPVGGIISRTLRTGQAQAIADLASEPEDSHPRILARRHGIRSSASFPIRTGHMVVGTLQCVSDRPGYFDPPVMALLGRLAAAASTMLVVIEHEHRRREIEQHLTNSEQRQRGLFELAPVAILVRQPDHIEVNGSFLEMFRVRDQAALEAAGLASIVDPADAKGVAALGSSLEAGADGPRITQSRGRRTDGSTFPMLVERVQLELDGAPAVVIFVTDLTPLETAEEKSRQSRAQLDVLVNNAPLAFLTLDCDAIIRSWNPAAEKIFGRSRSDAIGRVTPGGQKHLESIRRIASGNAEHMRGQLVRHVRLDGQTIDLRISTAPLDGRDGKPFRLLVVAEDVTDQTRAEAERDRLATAIDQSSESIVITDEQAHIEYVNPAFERVTGYKRAEVMGKNPRFLQSGIHNATFYAAMWSVLTRGKTWRGTFVNRTRNGRLFEEEAAISPVFDAAGKLSNYVAVKRDVTRERRSEQALRQSEERFRSVFDFASDAIFIRDVNGRFLEANRAACDRLGYSRDQLLTMSVADINTPGHAALFLSRTEELLEKGSASFESDEVRRDGTVMPVEINATVIDLAGRKAILSVVRDITARKMAETALRASEARYRAIVDQAPVAIGVSRHGLILDVNDRLREMHLLAADEVVAGRPLAELIAPESREDIEGISHRRMQGDPAPNEYETTGLRADGSRFPMHVAIVPIELPDGAATLGIMTDLSDQKRAEREREESRAQLQAIVDSTSDLIWSVDPIEYSLLAFNRAMTEFFQRERGIRLRVGTRLHELFPPGNEYLPVWRDLYGRVLREGPFTTDYRVSTGTRVLQISLNPVSRQGQVFAISVFGKDVTEKRIAEEAVRRSDERFRNLFDLANDAIFIREVTGRFLEVNRAACERLGYSREELLSMSPQDIDAPEFAALLPERTAALMSKGSAFFQTAHVCRDGSVLPVEMSATVIDLDGRKAVLTLARDISERNRADAERVALEDQLRQAQKMEGLGRLAGGVAHDFNNLLTAIRGSASLALASLPPGLDAREDLELIEQAADRAADLTRQLLAFARRTDVRPQPIDLGHAVRHIEPMLRRLIGEHIDLIIRTPEGMGAVRADLGQIEQVIVNLAVNAGDAMPDGGTLTIEIADIDDAVTVPGGSGAGPRTVLAVTDTGVGIDAATREHLFEPFFTTKDPGKGTGLGLATVYGIVRQAGGTIEVHTVPGQGSTFAISLPRVPAANQDDSPRPQVTASAGSRTGTILVVEDDPGVRRFACRVLEAAGYTVLATSNGPAAIQAALDQPIQLVLTDMVMPGMSGRELSARLTATRPHIKTLYMSGHADRGLGTDGRPEDGIEFMAKPFSRDVLLKVVERALAGADSASD